MVDIFVWTMVFVTVGFILWLGVWYVKMLDQARRETSEAFTTMLCERDFRAKAEADLMVLRSEYQHLQTNLAKTLSRLEAVTGPTSLEEIREIRSIKSTKKKRRPTSKLRVVANGKAEEADPESPPEA